LNDELGAIVSFPDGIFGLEMAVFGMVLVIDGIS